VAKDFRVDDFLLLADRRMVGFSGFGPPGGLPVVICHGGPGSRLAPRRLAASAGASSLRLIGIDRPGYGLSTPLPGRTIGSWVPDALAVLDELGVDRFIAAGTSTGGAYALALAALAPERALGCVVCCGLSDLRWAEGKAMASVNRMGEMFDADRETALAIASEVLGPDGGRMATAMENVQLTPADMEVVRDPEWMAAWNAEIPEMFAQGVVGYADDRLADGMGWGSFDVGAITCPVVVLHGGSDQGVPVAHAHNTAKVVPGAELRIFEHHGHFSISTELLPVLNELAARVGKRGHWR
jgi:pimeloyl-ACP methyl ester carboxylesterase